MFYLGVAKGEETQSRVFGVGTREATRSLTRLGAAFLWRGENSAFRVGFHSEERESNSFELTSGVYQVLDNIDESSWGIGGIYANIMISYLSRDITLINETGGVERNEERRAYHLGWVPREGLAVVLRSEKRGLKWKPSGFSQERALQRIEVTWQF